MIKKDDELIVKITGIKEYGVFFEYYDYSGLIHISELSDRFIKNVGDFFKKDELIKIKVIGIDYDNKRISGSYKQIDEKKINRYFDIGFDSLEEKTDIMINNKLKEIRENE